MLPAYTRLSYTTVALAYTLLQGKSPAGAALYLLGEDHVQVRYLWSCVQLTVKARSEEPFEKCTHLSLPGRSKYCVKLVSCQLLPLGRGESEALSILEVSHTALIRHVKLLGHNGIRLQFARQAGTTTGSSRYSLAAFR